MLKLIRFNEAESYQPQKGWKRASLMAEKEISIEHFVKPPGHASPSHHHQNTQVLVVLKGRITVETDSSLVEAGEGDAVYVSPGEEHVVTNPLSESAIGLDIFVPGRSFDFWRKRGNSGPA